MITFNRKHMNEWVEREWKSVRGLKNGENVKINFSSFRFIGKVEKICKFFSLQKTPSKLLNKCRTRGEIYTELIFLESVGDGGMELFMDTHVEEWKSQKKIDSKSIMCFCCLTSLQFCLTHHYLLLPLPWETEKEREIYQQNWKGMAILVVDEKEEWGRGYFTEKSCTRKDINALAFFPLRLIENYIPSFIRQWRRRARENANICYEK